MSTLATRKIEPLSGTTVTLGEAGDTVAVPTGGIVKTNTVKDAGGNTLLTSDGAGTFSSVNSQLKGNMTWVASQTASDVVSVEFTNLSTTYDSYEFYYVNINPSTDSAEFGFQTSVNPVKYGYGIIKTTTAFSAQHSEGGSGSMGYESSYDLAQATDMQWLANSVGNGDDESASGCLKLFNPASPTFVKHFYARTSYYHKNDLAMDLFIGGYVNSSTSLRGIKFMVDTGTMTGTIHMYGIL